jgi:hypothetical protein
VFNQVSKTFSNPFKIVAQYFDNTPLINITTRTVIFKIPWLTEEEFERQKMYLKSWLDRNKEIIDEWKKLVESMSNQCDKYNDDPQKNKNVLTNIKSIFLFIQILIKLFLW